MTDQQQTDPTPAADDDDQAADDLNTTEDTDQQPDTDNPAVAKAFKDAKRYRLELRDAEAERDELRGVVDDYHRAEAERLAADRLADPADLWRDGAKLATVLDDTGKVDPTRVNDLAGALVDEHPHWAKPRKTRPHPKDLKSGLNLAHVSTKNWDSLLKGHDN